MAQKMYFDDPVIDEAIKSRIGKESEPELSVDEVCPSEIRRYVQATMNDSPLFYDEQYARSTKFGPACGPATMVLRMGGHYKRPLGAADPIRNKGVNFDFRETAQSDRIPWEEIGMATYHGGDEIEYLQLPRVGDRTSSTHRLAEVIEKTGRSGRLAVTITEGTVTNQRGEVLCIRRGFGIVKEIKGDAWKDLRKR